MSKRLFNLRNVPDDEANDVRALLDQARLDWYETPASPWGISHGALWLKHAEDWKQAKALLDDYQRQRGESARRERAQAQSEGREQTFAQLLRERPVFVLVTLGGMLLIVALTLALPWILLN